MSIFAISLPLVLNGHERYLSEVGNISFAMLKTYVERTNVILRFKNTESFTELTAAKLMATTTTTTTCATRTASAAAQV